MQIKDKKLVALLKKRQEVIEDGYPLYDEIEKIVTHVIQNNMPKIASDNEMWKYIRPYIDPKEYNAANAELGKVYRKLQKKESIMTRLKEKTMAIVDKLDLKLGEFEEIETVKLVDGKATVNIVDMVESYKAVLREKKNGV